MFAEHKLRKAAAATAGIDLVFNVHDGSVDTGNKTVYTFSGEDIGTPDDNRIVAVGITSSNAGSAGPSISGVTIGGVNAELSSGFDLGNSQALGIAYAIIPTGTNADVVVTHDGGTKGCAIQVYSFRLIEVAEIDNIESGSFGSNTYIVPNIECVKGGVILTSAATFDQADTNVWSGAATAVKDAELNTDPGFQNTWGIFFHILPEVDSSNNDLTITQTSTSIASALTISFGEL